MVRILLADDHPLIRTGLHTTLEQEKDFVVIGEATTSAETYRLCEEFSPDILLLDLGMPGPSPATTIRLIMDQCPQVKIIILTAHDDEVYVRNLVGLGVAGYILKDEAPETLVRAIQAAVEGDAWLAAALSIFWRGRITKRGVSRKIVILLIANPRYCARWPRALQTVRSRRR